MHNLTAYTLYSGSSGNAVYVRSSDTEILIDAGVSARAVENGLRAVGSSLSNIQAIFVTHEHSDHTKGLEVISKKHHIPTHMTDPSARALIRDPRASLLGDLYLHPQTGFTVRLGNTTVHAFPTPHDSAAAVGYSVEYRSDNGETEKFALATDIGHVSDVILQELSGADSVVIEANHDVEMLLSGPYPYHLKRRILSDRGHLSNESSAELAAYLARRGTKNFVLGHLSKENNYPPTAEAVVRAALGGFENVTLAVASPDEPTRIV
ncbi:MAG: MBL fold metallo-hydrolase [Clostridia bacterium]|nr:MBL fold metallo-hydrolase [Clostridia bacterium]